MPLACSSQLIDQIWVLNTHADMKFRTQMITQKEFCYLWSQNKLVICPIPVLSLSRLTTSGDRTTDELHMLPSVDMSPGGISPEGNMSKKRRRRRSSSTFSSSRSADSRKRSRKSKRFKHSHKNRRRRLTSSSPSDNQSHDYGNYKRST